MHRRDVPERRSSRRRTLLSSEERTRLPSPNSGENRSSKATVGTSSKAEAATAERHNHAAAASKNPALTAMAGRIAAGCLSAPDLFLLLLSPFLLSLSPSCTGVRSRAKL